MQAHNLIGLINEYTKNRNIPVGKIDIMRKFSFFEVPSDFENDILIGMADSNWNGNLVNVEVSQAPGTKSARGGRSRSGNNRSYSGRGNRKRSDSSASNDRKGGRSSRNSSAKKEGGGRSSRVSSSSFKGRFNAAAKRKRIN